MPIGSAWASGSWVDGAWADGTWADAVIPPPVIAQEGGGMYARPRRVPVALTGGEEDELLIALLLMEYLIND